LGTQVTYAFTGTWDEPDDLPADFLRRDEVPPPNTSRDAVFAQPQWSCADEVGRLDAAGDCVAVAEKPAPPKPVACRQPVMSVSKSTKPHPEDAGSRRRLGFGAVWLAVWLAVAGYFGLGWLKTLAQSSDAGPAAACATEEQQVARRTKKIEDIRPGDYVLSRDPETGEVSRKRVLDAFTRTADHLRILKLRSSDGTVQELETTDEHPFWVSNHGFVPAGELKVGDKIDQSDGHPATVVSTHYEAYLEGHVVYNFTVEGNHTYFVAANGTRAPPVFVHNADCNPLGGNKAFIPEEEVFRTATRTAPANSAGRLRDPATGRFISDPANPPSPYTFTDAQRRAAWKQLAEDPNSSLTAAQRAEIQSRGWRGPQQLNKYGELETMELSHEPIPLREGGTQVVPRWPADHSAVDPHRHLPNR